MRNLLLVFLASLISLSVFGQRDETLFSRSGLSLSGAWGGSSLNLTKFSDDNAVFRGGYGGLEFNKSVFLGWGGFSLQNDLRFDSFDNKNLEMRYNGFMLGYAPKANKVVHPKFMVLIGGGNIDLEDAGNDKVLVVQPSAGLEVNIFRWFRIGLEGGYRMVTDTDLPEITDNDLSAFYGEVKFKFGWSWGQ